MIEIFWGEQKYFLLRITFWGEQKYFLLRITFWGEQNLKFYN